MKLKTLTISATLLASLVAGPVLAADAASRVGNPVERRGDRIEHRLDKRGDHINNRLDRRAAKASANGHDMRAARLDHKGNRITHRLDRTGQRVERRTDRFARSHG